MFRTLLRFLAIASFVGSIAACSGTPFYHEHMMRGQVASVEGSKVVVCIGSEDGAEPGMILDISNVSYSGSITEGTDNYRRELVGKIRIDSIIDKHFARASIVDGNIKPNDVAELKRD